MPDAATHRLQRLRARGLALEGGIDAAAPASGSLSGTATVWTSERVAATVERTLHALADAPRAPMLTPAVLAALLVGEWDSARAWLDCAAREPAEHTLLHAAIHAFTGDASPSENAGDIAPPSPVELRQRVQQAAATAVSDDEGALCAFVALVHELIGPAPDAARDRLTLRVELPAGWQSWHVRNLRMGDGAFDAVMTRLGDGVHITVEQTEGALPATLILEATVRSPVAGVEIDGRQADLALRPAADHVVAPVQLVLDAPRVMRILLREP